MENNGHIPNLEQTFHYVENGGKQIKFIQQLVIDKLSIKKMWFFV